jgi:hypothetical protein
MAEIKAIKRRQSPLAGLLAGKLDHVIASRQQILKLSHPLLEVRSFETLAQYCEHRSEL